MSRSLNNEKELEFQKLYHQLNVRQRQVVDTTEGVVIVNAGPGTGKTQVLSLRIANILRKTDLAAKNILCLTFTDAAVKNMKNRLYKIIGSDFAKINIFTYHSFANEIIGRNPVKFFNGQEFTPIDDVMSYKIFNQIFDKIERGNSLSLVTRDGYFYSSTVKDLIGKLKKSGYTTGDFKEYVNYLTQVIDHFKPLVEIVKSIKADNRLSFDIALKISHALQTHQQYLNNFFYENKSELNEEVLTAHVHITNKINETITYYINTDHTGIPKTQLTKRMSSFLKLFEKNKDGELELCLLSTYKKLSDLSLIYSDYCTSLNESGFYDFDDMIMNVIQVLDDPENIDLLYQIREQFQYILVDEFQDTSGVQLKLLNLLINDDQDNNPNCMVVGDPDQTIFKFQGANHNNISVLKESFPDSIEINLNTSYRANQQILDLAFSIISQAEIEIIDKREKLTSDRVT
jgi:DNA helicase II / ATP-dependent DNA helicase PcrA